MFLPQIGRWRRRIVLDGTGYWLVEVPRGRCGVIFGGSLIAGISTAARLRGRALTRLRQ